MSEQFSLRLPKDIKIKLQALSDATGRSKAVLTQDALERYLELEAWQIKAIQQGIKSADDGQLVQMSEIKQEWNLE